MIQTYQTLNIQLRPKIIVINVTVVKGRVITQNLVWWNYPVDISRPLKRMFTFGRGRYLWSSLVKLLLATRICHGFSSGQGSSLLISLFLRKGFMISTHQNEIPVVSYVQISVGRTLSIQNGKRVIRSMYSTTEAFGGTSWESSNHRVI